MSSREENITDKQQVLMAEKACKRRKKGKKASEKIKMKHLCSKCGLEAVRKKHLCKPVKIRFYLNRARL